MKVLNVITILYGISVIISLYKGWVGYKAIYKQDEGLSKGYIALMIFISLVPVANSALSIVNEDIHNFKREYNKAFKCRNCTITSRKWQVTDSRCPHCNKELYSYNEVPSNKHYPLAKVLKGRLLYKYIDYRYKLIKAKELNNDSELYDKELEAWTKLQEDKLTKQLQQTKVQ